MAKMVILNCDNFEKSELFSSHVLKQKNTFFYSDIIYLSIVNSTYRCADGRDVATGTYVWMEAVGR